MLELSLMPCYFELVKSGKKTVEGRVDTHKFKTLVPGETVIFIKNGAEERLVCIVKAINRYKDFRSMLLAEGLEKMLPGNATLNQGIHIYENLPHYKDKVRLYGAIAITIELTT